MQAEVPSLYKVSLSYTRNYQKKQNLEKNFSIIKEDIDYAIKVNYKTVLAKLHVILVLDQDKSSAEKLVFFYNEFNNALSLILCKQIVCTGILKDIR